MSRLICATLSASTTVFYGSHGLGQPAQGTGDIAPRSASSDAERLAEAKEHFRRGLQLIERGEIESALQEFLRSRSLVASGKNSTNAAICLQRLGRDDEALELYEDVFARFFADLDDDDRRALVQAISELRERVAYLEVIAPAGSVVVVDGRARGRLPLRAPIRLLSGEHRVLVVREGQPGHERSVAIARGETATVRVEPAPALPAAPPPPSPSPPPRRAAVTANDATTEPPRWPMILTISGGALAVLGTTTLLVANANLEDARDRLSQDCLNRQGDECIATTPSLQASAQDAVDDIQTAKAVRTVGIVTGAAGLGSALVGLLWHFGQPKARPKTAVAVTGSASEIRLALSGVF